MQKYEVQVINLSPNATEKDVRDFFSFSGTVENVELERAGDEAQVAFVTFRDRHALETAILLSAFSICHRVAGELVISRGSLPGRLVQGATIVDQRVCIVRWGESDESYDLWGQQSWKLEEEDQEYQESQGSHLVSTPREAVTLAQEVVTSMLSKGYVLGKDALAKAKAFDEAHQVTASASAKVASLSRRMGITDKINAGAATVRAVDERYQVCERTKTVLSAGEQTMSSAGTAIVNSRYFSAGALWVSGVLSKAAKAAADLGNRGNEP